MTIHIPVWLFWPLVIIVIPLVLYLVMLGVIAILRQGVVGVALAGLAQLRGE